MIFGSHTTNKIVQYNSGKSNTQKKKQSKGKKEKTFKCSLFCEGGGGGALALKEKLSKHKNLLYEPSDNVWTFIY